LEKLKEPLYSDEWLYKATALIKSELDFTDIFISKKLPFGGAFFVFLLAAHVRGAG